MENMMDEMDICKFISKAFPSSLLKSVAIYFQLHQNDNLLKIQRSHELRFQNVLKGDSTRAKKDTTCAEKEKCSA